MVTVDYSLGPTYCTVEDVQETLGLPSPDDPQGIFEFSEVSNPTYSRVEKMIMMAEVPTRIMGLRLKATMRPIPSTEPGMT